MHTWKTVIKPNFDNDDDDDEADKNLMDPKITLLMSNRKSHATEPSKNNMKITVRNNLISIAEIVQPLGMQLVILSFEPHIDMI